MRSALMLGLSALALFGACMGAALSGESTTTEVGEMLRKRREDIAALLKEAADSAKDLSLDKDLAHSATSKEKRLEVIVNTLGELRAQEAVPFLIEIIRFKSPSWTSLHSVLFDDFPAAVALVKVGMPAIPALTKELENKEPCWLLAFETIRHILGARLTELSISDEKSFVGLSAEARQRCQDYLRRSWRLGDREETSDKQGPKQ